MPRRYRCGSRKSLNLQVEPTIRAVSGLLIGVTTLIQRPPICVRDRWRCGKEAPFRCAAPAMTQHRVGELTFWSALRIDPLNVALRLCTASADVEAGERTVFRARQRISLAKGFGQATHT